MLLEGCGKVPQATPSGGTPTSSSFVHLARVLLLGPMPCTHLDTQPVALPETGHSSGGEERALGRQQPVRTAFCRFPASVCKLSWQPLEHRMAGCVPAVQMLAGHSSCSTFIPAGHGHIFPLARIRPRASLSLGSFEPVHPPRRDAQALG